MVSQAPPATKPEVTERCSLCRYLPLCLPATLGKGELREIELTHSGRRTLRKGEVLYAAGDVLDTLYFVYAGSFKLTSSRNGREQVVGFHLPGEVLGLDALEHRVHNCRATALEPSEVCLFPHQRFRNLCRRHTRLMEAYEALAGREIVKEHELLLLHGQLSARERLCHFLVSMAGRLALRGKNASEFRLPMNRDELGNYLGLAPETLSRLFKELAAQGLISVRAKQIRLLDLPALKESLETCRECPAETPV